MSRPAAALALLLLLPLAGLPVPADAQQRRANGDTLVSMDYQDMELADVIKAVAKFTGRNFLYDDRVRGRVTVISETPITVDEAYRVFESILQVKGFTAVEGPGDVIKIIPIREAKESPLETVTGEGRAPARDLFITRLVPLKYVKAETIANTFRPLVSKDANVIAYAPTNTMILTDTAANVRRLLTILAEIDVETYQEQVKVIPVEYADAAELAGQLQEIFGEGDRGAPTPARRATRARAQRAARAQAAAAAEAIGSTFGSAGEARFITDERTNSIIVIAPAATIRQVERLVVLLDYKRKGTGRIHVYRLQNADAEEMAQTLSTLAGGGAGLPTAPARPGTPAGAAGQAGATVATLEGGVRITADAPTNALIIQASAEGFAAIRDVIQDLDLRRPQVMVEALIMEVDVTDNQALGAGFLYRGLMGGEDGRQIAIGSANPALVRNSDPNAPGLDNLAGRFATAVIGRTIEIVDPDDPMNTIEVPVIQGLLTATASDSDTNIISAPILLTADNEEAQIIVGQNIPVLSSRVQTPDAATAGSFNTSANIERQDVGVTLRVTPQISEGDSVRLEIFQEISDLISESDELGPTTSNRQVENTVYVKDGEAVMIGGILQDRLLETETKVPWLGDIPVLGWPFRSTSETINKINLMVVLTPHIVRDPADLQKLTIEQREKFRAAAGRSQEWSREELEERQKAREAGIELPMDDNPVRRRLDEHTKEYPTESFPLLEQEQAERREQRREEREEQAALAGGLYSVQVSVLRSPAEAAALLEELIDLGYDGSLVSRREGEESLHSVVLGPYPTEDRAAQVAREIRAETGRSALVIADQ